MAHFGRHSSRNPKIDSHSTFSRSRNHKKEKHLFKMGHGEGLEEPIGSPVAAFPVCALTHLTTSKETS